MNRKRPAVTLDDIAPELARHSRRGFLKHALSLLLVGLLLDCVLRFFF